MTPYKTQRHAWAIETGEGTLIGVYRMSQRPLAPWHDGCRVALFRTRAQAREYLKRVKGEKRRGLYPDARVVRAKVSIRVSV